MSRTTHEAEILLGRNTVPVEVILYGEQPTQDERGHAKYPVIASVSSKGERDNLGHPGVAGIPVRFWAQIRRNPGGRLSIDGMNAYRTDKGYMEPVTDKTNSALYTALPAVVEALLAQPEVAALAQVEQAEAEVARAQRDLDKAREVAHEAARKVAMAEESLANVRASLTPA